MTAEMAKMKESYGVQVTHITVRGPAIEVAFVVSTAEKAGTALSPAAERYLIDQRTGTKILPPAAVRSRILRPGPAIGPERTFTAVFDNSAGLVKAGDKVTVVMGEYQVGDLPVR
jgi:hypothetical protein